MSLANMKFSATRWYGFFGAIVGYLITFKLFIPAFTSFPLRTRDEAEMFITLCGAALCAVPGAAIGFLVDWRWSQEG